MIECGTNAEPGNKAGVEAKTTEEVSIYIPKFPHLFHPNYINRRLEQIYETVKSVATAEVKVPFTSPLQLEYTVDASKHNADLLETFNFDLDQLIDANPGTTSSYGSEL